MRASFADATGPDADDQSIVAENAIALNDVVVPVNADAAATGAVASLSAGDTAIDVAAGDSPAAVAVAR